MEALRLDNRLLVYKSNRNNCVRREARIKKGEYNWLVKIDWSILMDNGLNKER